MNRREFIAATGTVCIGCGGTGCMSTITSDENRIRLLGVTVSNVDTKPHTFHVLVREDDEIVHWSTHRIESSSDTEYGSTEVKKTWSDEAARFEVSGRVDRSSTWKTTDFDGQDKCAAAKFQVERNGEFQLMGPLTCEDASTIYNKTDATN